MSIINKTFQAARGNAPGSLVLQQAGPVLAVEIYIPEVLASLLASKNQSLPQPVAGYALIDTGATRSAVDTAVIQKLGVQPTGTATVGTAAGPVSQGLFAARFGFPEGRFGFDANSVLGVNLEGQRVGNTSIIALIGRDLLTKCVLIYNGPMGVFTLCSP